MNRRQTPTLKPPTHASGAPLTKQRGRKKRGACRVLEPLIAALLLLSTIWSHPAGAGDGVEGDRQPASPVEVGAERAPDSSLTPGVLAEYVLGPGDELNVTDYSIASTSARHKAFTMQVPILPDGTINVFPVGLVHAAGLNLTELNRVVNEGARQYMSNPEIVITVSRIRPVVVYVLGEVVNPGMYSAELPRSVFLPEGETPPALGNITVTSALQRAGGLKESANVRSVLVYRQRLKEPLQVDLWRLLVDGDTSQDLALHSGDAIFVPPGGAEFDPSLLGLAANRLRRVRVWGAVKTPGLYDLQPNDDLLSVIAKAGGFTPSAVTGSVLLSRVKRDGTVETHKVSLKRSLTKREYVGRSPIKPGDVVVVRDSQVKRQVGKALTTGLALGSAIAVLILSRNIPDNSQPQSASAPVPPPAPQAAAGGVVFF